MGLVLLILLILLLVGGLPQCGLTTTYGPSGVMTVLLIVLIVLLLAGLL